jgi:hypothetical protein
MSHTADLHLKETLPRVFLLFTEQTLNAAEALMDALAKEGVEASPKVRMGERSQASVVASIASADVFVVLITPGDEFSKSIQYETRLALKRCWDDPTVRVLTIAPAVGAIPASFRHQPFSKYIPSSNVHLDDWTATGVPPAFVSEILNSPNVTASVASLPSGDFGNWRNRLVHLGGNPSLNEDDFDSIRMSLEVDRITLNEVILRAEAEEATFTAEDAHSMLERALLSRLADDVLMTDAYYEMALRVRARTPHTDVRAADLDFGLGLLAMEAADFSQAVDLFSTAVDFDFEQLTPTHPASIAAAFNLALSYTGVGDSNEAEKWFTEALASARTSLGEYHPQTAAIAFNLGRLEINIGRPEVARPLLELAANAYRRVRPDESTELENVLAEISRLDALGH